MAALKSIMIGDRFTRLVVKGKAPRNKINRKCWRCHCDCGKDVIVEDRHLRRGQVKSCGCWRIERRFKHGKTTHTTKSREYGAWISAKSRCFNPKNKHYKNYGGRGITMCEEWRNDFAAFDRYMGRCPPRMTLDRYPNQSGNYESGNCRWATRTEQNRNTRSNRYLTYEGQTKLLSDWSRELGIPITTILGRLDLRGQSVTQALCPVRKGEQMHIRWHVKRGIVNPFCALCQEQVDPG